MTKKLKAIGLIGSSFQSTLCYYKGINYGVSERLGGLNSAEILLYNTNFAEIEDLIKSGLWGVVGKMLGNTAMFLAESDADCIVIASNTMHMVADKVKDCLQGLADKKGSQPTPFIHIGDATAKQCQKKGIKKVGLLGTYTTMTEDFFIDRLKENGLKEVILPDSHDEMVEIDRIILKELRAEKFKSGSVQYIREEIWSMAARGAKGVIIACPELRSLFSPLLPDKGISIGEYDIPIIDSTQAHIDALLDFCIVDKS